MHSSPDKNRILHEIKSRDSVIYRENMFPKINNIRLVHNYFNCKLCHLCFQFKTSHLNFKWDLLSNTKLWTFPIFFIFWDLFLLAIAWPTKAFDNIQNSCPKKHQRLIKKFIRVFRPAQFNSSLKFMTWWQICQNFILINLIFFCKYVT